MEVTKLRITLRDILDLLRHEDEVLILLNEGGNLRINVGDALDELVNESLNRKVLKFNAYDTESGILEILVE